ncbi:hypothetical protein [Scytonema sp. NUACC26]|uniref:hypothetical protein n=1 Tax=Scytonema sp. NUACC26 TaxID=3140176 RepID=UPI0034DC985D
MRAWFVLGIVHHESNNVISEIFFSKEEAEKWLNSIDKTSNEYNYYDDFEVDSEPINEQSLVNLLEKSGNSSSFEVQSFRSTVSS